MTFVVFILTNVIKILKEYEKGVVFTLGRVGRKAVGPGLILLVPGIQVMRKIDMRTLVHDVPTQDVISRDNVSVKVNAVIYYRVVDAVRAVVQVENYMSATPARSSCSVLIAVTAIGTSWMFSERRVAVTMIVSSCASAALNTTWLKNPALISAVVR